MRTRWIKPCLLTVLLALGLSLGGLIAVTDAQASEADTAAEAESSGKKASTQESEKEGEKGSEKKDEEPAPPADAVDKAIAAINKAKLGVVINRKEMYVDVKAKVCLRSAEFLEMFACTKDTREHESILVIEAKPSTIHYALILLGQKPGKPLRYDDKFDPPKLVPATGPEVQVFIAREVAGTIRETPANRWVKDNKTEKVMPNNIWLFAGSRFAKVDGKEIYEADVNGSVVSLVNFGDDLLTHPNKMTHANESHTNTWAPRTKMIPKVGTEVMMRLRVKAPDRKAEPGDKPEAKEADKPDGDGEPGERARAKDGEKPG